MADNARIGSYEFERDPKGVRIRWYDAANRALPCWVLLWITLTEEGQAPVSFRIDRLLPLPDGHLEFHGYTTDRVALDGTIRPDMMTGGVGLELQIINASEPMRLRLTVNLELTGEADPRWMVPGFFYRDNHVEGCTRVFPQFSEIRRDPGRMISSAWSFRSDRTAVPAVFCWTYTMMAWVATQQVVGGHEEAPEGLGQTSMELGCEDGHPRLGFEFPHREAPIKFSYCHDDKTAPEQAFLDLEKNTVLELAASFGFGPPDLHGYANVMRSLSIQRLQEHRPAERLEPELAERLAVHGLKRWHLEIDAGMIHETSAFDKHFGRRGTNVERQHMHTGWLSGAMPAYALLWGGREDRDQRLVDSAHVILDQITEELAPCGTLWPLFIHNQGFTGGFGPAEGLAHSRTIAEALLYLIRALRLELAANATHPGWLAAIRSSLDYIVGVQRQDGAFPSYYVLESGAPHSFDGIAGLAWVAPLAAGATLLHRKEYRAAASRAAAYYSRMIEDEFLYGGVEDQPLVPTCDDGHLALVSYLHLYECEPDEQWLELARKAADYALTWRMCHNVGFHPDTLLARYGIRTRGGDISSVAAPILSASGMTSHAEMLKLAALTGDEYYRVRAEEARTFAHQLVARHDGEFNARKGQAAAQLFHTDWWQPKGMMLSLGHAWICGAIKYVELVQRTLVISNLRDTGGVVDAPHTLRAGSYFEEVVLQEPMERRSRDTRFDLETPAVAAEGEGGWKMPSFLSGEEVRLPSAGPPSKDLRVATPPPRAPGQRPVTHSDFEKLGDRRAPAPERPITTFPPAGSPPSRVVRLPSPGDAGAVVPPIISPDTSTPRGVPLTPVARTSRTVPLPPATGLGASDALTPILSPDARTPLPAARQSRTVRLPPPSSEPFSLAKSPTPESDALLAHQTARVPPPPPADDPFLLRAERPPRQPTGAEDGGPDIHKRETKSVRLPSVRDFSDAGPRTSRLTPLPPPASEPFSLGSSGTPPPEEEYAYAEQPEEEYMPPPPPPPEPYTPRPQRRESGSSSSVGPYTPRPLPRPVPSIEGTPPPGSYSLPTRKEPAPQRGESGEVEIKWKIF